MEEYKKVIRASYVSIFVGLVICLMKFAGYYLTGSHAILSDALESIINVLAASFAAYAVTLTQQKADNDHPYGKGRIEYFSAGFEGGLISLAGLVILYESLPQIFTGKAPQQLDLGIYLVVLGTIMNGILGWYLVKAGKKYYSQALTADGHHVYSDVVTSLGMIAGLIVVYFTEIPWLDPLIACIMGIWILFSGFRILRSSVNRLMDRVNQDSLIQVSEILDTCRKPEMIRPHKLRLREAGPRLLVDFHMVIPRYYSVSETHELETRCSSTLAKGVGRPLDLMVHFDPCADENCRFCRVADCKIRNSESVSDEVWTPEFLQSDILHPFEKDPRP